MKRAIAGVLAASLFSACAVGPNYSRPSVEVPPNYRGQATKAGGPSDVAFADLPWWEVFRDQELQNLIRTALENNKDVKIA
ncbi:MAG TPA: TolC family protein, partial [bacterium]|nr:TolC family protein [bacterium]